MNRKKSFDLTEELHNKIISAAYGDAGFFDKIRVLRAIAKNPEAKKLYASYMLTAAEVKQIREENFTSDFVTRLAGENVPAIKHNRSMMFDFLSVLFARPVISFATALILIASIVYTLTFNKPVPINYNKVNEAEVLRAEEQAKYALAIVDNIFQKANQTLQNEILNEKVTKPIKESVGIVNNILKGEKNENN